MRRKLFSGDNLFFRLMGRLGDLMCLNMLFLLTSLPVVTAGASISALYEVLYDISMGREGNCFKKHIRAFRKHFGAATGYWMLCLAAVLFLASGIWGAGYMERGSRIFFQGFYLALFLMWAGMLSFGLILISWAGYSVGQALRSAALITVGSFPWLIVNLTIGAVPVLFLLSGNRFVLAYGTPLFVLFGIPLSGMAKTCVYRRALKKYGLRKKVDVL